MAICNNTDLFSDCNNIYKKKNLNLYFNFNFNIIIQFNLTYNLTTQKFFREWLFQSFNVVAAQPRRCMATWPQIKFLSTYTRGNVAMCPHFNRSHAFTLPHSHMATKLQLRFRHSQFFLLNLEMFFYKCIRKCHLTICRFQCHFWNKTFLFQIF